VTVSWWALALYPAGAQAPEWLLRTRLVCFGAAAGGLPNAGGWILLIGEPIGMTAVLATIWGGALSRDVRAVWTHLGGRVVLVSVLGLLGWGIATTIGVVQRVTGKGSVRPVAAGGFQAQAIAIRTPPLALTDQHGELFDLQSLVGRPVIVTFAFAHCETICPTLVRDVLRARRDAGREDIPLVVVTVDPWRDVPSRLPAIAAAWDLASNDRVLSGAIDSVNHALDVWGVGRSRSDTTGDLSHAAVVVLVDRTARRARRLDGAWERLAGLLSKA
jgi:cytochrome oxidase Cu insertion factor (SCO1/SenC/PrrC family)